MLDPARCGLILIPAGGPATSEQFWLSEEQVKRLAPYFPRSRGKARVDDRRVLSGIIHV